MEIHLLIYFLNASHSIYFFLSISIKNLNQKNIFTSQSGKTIDCIPDFSSHLVCINPTLFKQSTSDLHSDLPSSNQQPMVRTKSRPTFFINKHYLKSTKVKVSENMEHVIHKNSMCIFLKRSNSTTSIKF